METISVADATAHLSELVDRAKAGEAIALTQHGQPVARLMPLPDPRKPIDMAAVRRFTDSLAHTSDSAAELVRSMRDDDRY